MINTTPGPSGIIAKMSSYYNINILIVWYIICKSEIYNHDDFQPSIEQDNVKKKKKKKSEIIDKSLLLTFFVFSDVHSMFGGGLLSTSHIIVT